jgi:hypothetical protein
MREITSEEKINDEPELVSADHIENLIHSRVMDPTLIIFQDTGEIEVIPGPWMDDVSWSDRNRDYAVIINKTDIENFENWNEDDPGYQAVADLLNN